MYLSLFLSRSQSFDFLQMLIHLFCKLWLQTGLFKGHQFRNQKYIVLSTLFLLFLLLRRMFRDEEKRLSFIGYFQFIFKLKVGSESTIFSSQLWYRILLIINILDIVTLPISIKFDDLFSFEQRDSFLIIIFFNIVNERTILVDFKEGIGGQP